ncbi:MAG: AIR synthase related protein, partial [Acidobacteriota bacterium]
MSDSRRPEPRAPSPEPRGGRARDRILLAHGGGGRLTHELVRGTFLPALANPMLAALSDSAILPELPPGRPALTTDAFVVDPPVFPGGDLGYLSVCGTVNDLAVAGARPLWLTWALILEEGLEAELLQVFVEGAARAAREAGVAIVAGDTKVVPRGKG